MNTHADSHASPAHGHEHNDMAHVASAKLLLTVFAVLILLTILTVFLAENFHFGGIEVWVAMAIGTIKAVLVALYFMHLRYDKPFNILVFLSAFLFVSVFIGFTLMDSDQYQHDIQWIDKSKLGVPATPAN